MAKNIEENKGINIVGFFTSIKDLAKKAHIEDENTVRKLFEDSIERHFHQKYNPDAKLELILDDSKGIIKLINHSKLVVSDDLKDFYPKLEIPLAKAKLIDKNAEINSEVSDEISFSDYDKTDVQQILQYFKQATRDIEKHYVYEKCKSLIGEMVTAQLQSSSPTHAIFTINNEKAFMPSTEMNSRIQLRPGATYKVYVVDVVKDAKDAQIIVSLGSKEIVKRLFEANVPEVYEGVVEIVRIARIAGERSKVVVNSSNPNIDPVGSCVGDRGSRINAIVENLNGEKIDIIQYTEDRKDFIVNACSPSKVIGIVLSEETNYAQVIVPNRQYTLAIGRRGSNAKLVAELSGCKIDFYSLEKAAAEDLKFEWNGNVTSSDVEKIEAGIRVPSNARTRKPRNIGINNIAADFEKELEDFNESFEFPKGPRPNNTTTKTNYSKPQRNDTKSNDLETGRSRSKPTPTIEDYSNIQITDEELERMQEDFEFDSELASFDDLDFDPSEENDY